MGIFLLLLVAGYIAYRFVADRADDARQASRDTQRIAQRRAALVRDSNAPSSHEAFGDALREASRYREALVAYETAERLMAGGEATGVGILGGGGIENKIRLTRLDLTEEAERPASYLAQVARRESVCRQCGALNTADATHCVQCGLDLPTNTFLETWHRDEIRRPILREIREGVMIIAVVLLALYLSSWMPIEIQGLLLISTICVLGWKGLKAITDK